MCCVLETIVVAAAAVLSALVTTTTGMEYYDTRTHARACARARLTALRPGLPG